MSESTTKAHSEPAKWLTRLSTVCAVSGASLLLFYGSSLALTARANERGIEVFETARGAAQPVMVSTTAVATLPISLSVSDTLDKSEWSEKRISDFEALRDSGGLNEVPTGVMRIPSVNLVLPLYDGTDEYNLTRGAGIIEGTADLGSDGNTGLAAHRDGYFRSLKDVNVGDQIEVQTLNSTLKYRISEILIVDPSDTSVLDPGERGLITLVTCYPFYFVGSAPQRYIVQAELL